MNIICLSGQLLSYKDLHGLDLNLFKHPLPTSSDSVHVYTTMYKSHTAETLFLKFFSGYHDRRFTLNGRFVFKKKLRTSFL